MQKGRLYFLCVAFLAIIFTVFHLGCQRDDDEFIPQAELCVEIVPTDGLDPLNVDTLWVFVENTRSGLRDSLLSRFCKSVSFTVLPGNYTVRLSGARRNSKVITHFAGVLLHASVTAGRVKLSVPLEVSYTPNPDYEEESEEEERPLLPLRVKVSLPPRYATLSPDGVQVTVVDSLGGPQHTAMTNAQGVALFSLPEAHYRVSALGHLLYEGDTIVLFAGPRDAHLQPGLPVQRLPLEAIEPVELGEGALVITLKFPPECPVASLEGHRLDMIPFPKGTPVSQTTDKDGRATFQLPYGVYTVRQELLIPQPDGLRMMLFTPEAELLRHESSMTEFTLELQHKSTISGLIIKEIYFACSRSKASGERYDADRYMELYNNTPYTLYADGVSMCATFNNTMLTPGYQLFKNYVGTDEVVPGFIFTVPGSGRDHPIPPGGTLLLADQGLNHREICPGSPVDLSGADFEWYDDHFGDVDVPEVPNLIKYYSYSATVTVLHIRGYWGFFIMKADAPMEEFLPRYAIEETMPNGSSRKAYAIPSRYILDAVQGAAPTGPETNVFPPALESGYMYCSDILTGKCVRRKVVRRVDGRAILQDTNNSSDDFLMDVDPSPRVVP